MAMKGKTAYYTARPNQRGPLWRVYRVVEDCPDYPGVKWLEEPATKSVEMDEANRLVGVLMRGVDLLNQSER